MKYAAQICITTTRICACRVALREMPDESEPPIRG
jgi:hypothetical protein